MTYIDLSTITIEQSGAGKDVQYKYTWVGNSPYIALAPSFIQASNAVMYWADDTTLVIGPYTLTRHPQPIADGRLLFENTAMLPVETKEETLARQTTLSFELNVDTGAVKEVTK